MHVFISSFTVSMNIILLLRRIRLASFRYTSAKIVTASPFWIQLFKSAIRTIWLRSRYPRGKYENKSWILRIPRFANASERFGPTPLIYCRGGCEMRVTVYLFILNKRRHVIHRLKEDSQRPYEIQIQHYELYFLWQFFLFAFGIGSS